MKSSLVGGVYTQNSDNNEIGLEGGAHAANLENIKQSLVGNMNLGNFRLFSMPGFVALYPENTDGIKEWSVNENKLLNTMHTYLYNLSAQEIYALDIYMATNSAEANMWLLGHNNDNSPRIQIEVDRYIDPFTMQETTGTIFPIEAGSPGESFSNPYIYKRIERGFDDGSTVQRLPSHNARVQQNVKMIGGGNSSSVGEQWGKVRAVPPLYGYTEEQTDEFYNERSEWYINLGTRDDKVRIDIVISEGTNRAELNKYMKDIVIVIQPSQHNRLRKSYMYYDIDNEPPTSQNTGVTY